MYIYIYIHSIWLNQQSKSTNLWSYRSPNGALRRHEFSSRQRHSTPKTFPQLGNTFEVPAVYFAAKWRNTWESKEDNSKTFTSQYTVVWIAHQYTIVHLTCIIRYRKSMKIRSCSGSVPNWKTHGISVALSGLSQERFAPGRYDLLCNSHQLLDIWDPLVFLSDLTRVTCYLLLN